MFYFKKTIKRKKYLKLIIITTAFIFLITIYLLLSPILFKNWLNYPSELRANIAFVKWQESFKADCYGACLVDRQVLKEIILSHYLKSDSDILVEELRKEFLNTLNDQYSLAIVQVIKEIGATLPDNWQNIIEKNISKQAKAYLITYFPDDFVDDNRLKEDLKENIKSDLVKIDDKLISISSLAIYQSREIKDFLIDIVISDYPLLLKKEALKNLASLNKEQLMLLGDNLVNNAFHLALNSQIVWLISEHYQLHPELSAKYLSLVYQKKDLDDFSRGFSALALNELLQANLKLPELSQAQWEKYYQYY
jgi:hypothetical protein